MARHATEVRKGEIVSSARELLVQQGVKAITIRNIAKLNRITEGAIYRHFKNKRSILLALVDDFESHLFAAVDSTMHRQGDAIQTLRDIMSFHLGYTEKRKSELFAITAASVHFNDAVLRQRILKVIERYKDRIKEILVRGERAGMIKAGLNIDSVSLTFFGLIQISAIQYALTGYTVPPLTRFDALWDIFLTGVSSERSRGAGKERR